MDEYKQDKIYGPILAIIIILIVLVLSAYWVFNSAFDKVPDKEIIIDDNNTEIYINKKKQELNSSEVDVEKISKKLDELDINLDDVLKELDL